MPRIPFGDPMHRAYYGPGAQCRGHEDGECHWEGCPQVKDGEPEKTGRHCPLDNREDN
jgi:hypothetical protein